MFSSLSCSSISLATETPSLVMIGAPKLFSMMALRPFGPNVALTAFARTLTPRNIRWRASSLKLTSLAAITNPPRNNGLWLLSQECVGLLPVDDGHHVVLTHDDEILVVDLNFSP